MGKLYFYLSLLICLDILFVVTGQICSGDTACSLSSVVYSSLFNPAGFSIGSFFSALIGNISNLGGSSTGIASLIVGAAVTAGLVYFTRAESILYIPVALTLGGLASDFIVIATYLYNLNEVLAIMLMSPTLYLFVITLVEWVRLKD